MIEAGSTSGIPWPCPFGDACLVIAFCNMVLAVDQKQSKTLGAKAAKWSCKVGAYCYRTPLPKQVLTVAKQSPTIAQTLARQLPIIAHTLAHHGQTVAHHGQTVAHHCPNTCPPLPKYLHM